MDAYETLFSPSAVLNGQIAREIFDLLPEDGVIMVIMDKQGNSWPSDSERFSQLNISDGFLKELCAKINDGHEPIITQHEDTGIVAAQISGTHTDTAYAVIAIPESSPESTLKSMDLIEIILGQIDLIAKLIEKNDRLYENQMKQFSQYCQNTAVN